MRQFTLNIHGLSMRSSTEGRQRSLPHRSVIQRLIVGFLLALCIAPSLAQSPPLATSTNAGSTSAQSSSNVENTSNGASPTSSSQSLYTLTTVSLATVTLSPQQPLPPGAHPISSNATNQYVTSVTRVLTLGIASATKPSAISSPSPYGDSTATTALASDTSPSLPLQTVIDPAFGVLGAFLIISGLFMAFWGIKSTWSTVFFTGFYSLALITICIILRAGVAQSIYDPSPGLRGVFLVACVVIGAIGGILALIFRYSSTLLTACLGGFALGLLLQATRDGGLIRKFGMRYALYFGCTALTFGLHLIVRLQRPVIILSTALTGATAVILGVDCFTTAGLKEFYVRNIGFDDIFIRKYPDTFSSNRWPLTTAMLIEVVSIAAVTLMAAAFQWRLWSDLRRNIRAMREADEDRETRRKAEKAAKRIQRSAQADLQEWEKRYSSNNHRNMNAFRIAIERDGAGDDRERKNSSMNSLLNFMPRALHTTASQDSHGWDMESKGSMTPAAMTPHMETAPLARPTSTRPGSFLHYVATGQRNLAYLSKWDPGHLQHTRTNSAATLPPLDLGGSLSESSQCHHPQGQHQQRRQLASLQMNSNPSSKSAGSSNSGDPELLLDEIQRIRESIDNLRKASSFDLENASAVTRADDSKPFSATDGRIRAGSIHMSKTASNALLAAPECVEEETGDDTIASIRDLKAKGAFTRQKRHSMSGLEPSQSLQEVITSEAAEIPTQTYRAHRLSSSSPQQQQQRTITMDPVVSAARRASALPASRPSMSEVSPWTALPHRNSSESLSPSLTTSSPQLNKSNTPPPKDPLPPLPKTAPASPLAHLAPLDRAQSQSKLSAGGSMSLAQYEAKHKERLAAMQRNATEALLEREKSRLLQIERQKASEAFAEKDRHALKETEVVLKPQEFSMSGHSSGHGKSINVMQVPQGQAPACSVQSPLAAASQRMSIPNASKNAFGHDDAKRMSLHRRSSSISLDEIARQTLQHRSQRSLGGFASTQRPEPSSAKMQQQQMQTHPRRRHSASDLLQQHALQCSTHSAAGRNDTTTTSGRGEIRLPDKAASTTMNATAPAVAFKRASATLTETDRRRIAEGALQGQNSGGHRRRLSQPLLQFDNMVVEQALDKATAEDERRHKRASQFSLSMTRQKRSSMSAQPKA
ncbi:hypothetical protein K437DRAFT_134236 [Tilletiaria anomala UBC 951]|uniref:TM7S3/TM198-like domain-containing protein n=1 Tax=Tilletiaria anomala (strain ATCC 24038 / CBS 436.72 / UBC 951) TaxID=1037660 RepID=A0A066WQQ5_TILAU|nr:uncharacterized protein K437DRAFT_134236 [Tilletiaria anomala UBC 951]KDN52975.1 hypothetical protein K437DRAFT_134236 [Tilletiaria anomala UBC 951]